MLGMPDMAEARLLMGSHVNGLVAWRTPNLQPALSAG